jgi:MFS family permease
MSDRRKHAMQFVVLMGVVSLFADMCYEGMRSGIGQFLGLLGASGAAVGFIGGLGEAVGYGLRYVSGRIADRTHAYWGLTIAGYALTGLAVPLCALAPAEWMVAVLVALERLGKAVRNPARSTLLSFAGEEIGAGWTFGLHQALDQTGAVLGPLVVTAVVWWRGTDQLAGYRWAFAALAIPAIITIGLVLVSRARYPDPRTLRPAKGDEGVGKGALGRSYTKYLVGAALLAAGLADWALIAFHLGGSGAVPLRWLAIVYAGAMGVDALSSLIVGRLFDRAQEKRGPAGGVLVLAGVAVIAAAYGPLVFLAPGLATLAGVALWAFGAAATYSIGKAVVSQLTPAASRGRAFGGYYAVYGLAWWLGSFITGELYDHSRGAAAAFASACLIASAVVLVITARDLRTRAAG